MDPERISSMIVYLTNIQWRNLHNTPRKLLAYIKVNLTRRTNTYHCIMQKDDKNGMKTVTVTNVALNYARI